MNLTLSSKVFRTKNVMATPVDDELVMMQMEINQYFGLNAMGRRIWDMMEHPISVREICQQLVAEFDVEMAVCEREVLAFLSDLHESQVVELPADAKR